MFRGLTAVNLDSKGRLAIPKRHRQVLADDFDSQLVITIDTETRCLLLYPLSEWEVIEHKLQALPSFNPAARRIQRLLIGHATESELDAQGRILLPPLLRDYAQIDKHVMLVGQGKKFELWSEQHWQANRDAWLNETQQAGSWPESIESIAL